MKLLNVMKYLSVALCMVELGISVANLVDKNYSASIGWFTAFTTNLQLTKIVYFNRGNK